MQIFVTETDSMAIRSCESDRKLRYSVRSFSWELSNGTGQEFGFHAGWRKWLAVKERWMIRAVYCNALRTRVCKETPNQGVNQGVMAR